MKRISFELYIEFESEGEEIDKMLNGYIAFLKKSKQGANEPGATLSVREESTSYLIDALQDDNNTEEINI